ncbi:MAG: acyltransferase [Marinobacter sp.]|nr:acyltransferase [Marinobacter sp.]
MLKVLPGPLKGAVAVLLILLNTLVFLPLLLLLAIVKLIVPIKPFRKVLSIVINGIAVYWIGYNNTLMDLFHKIHWDIRGAEKLSRQDWYFVSCNHQGWADIPIMQYVFNSRIPLLKFFLKKELMWVPLMGVAWWALDFPFMRRYTKEQIARNPALKGKDLETTRSACEKFRYTPVTVFNFMEGTRFTPEKHARQQSPYQHLLKPKAGGTAFVLGAMGDMLHTMLDVTIVYPQGRSSFWDFLCGRITEIVVHVNKIEIPQQFLGMDYSNDPEIRKAFHQWLAGMWEQKDALIESILKEKGVASKAAA